MTTLALLGGDPINKKPLEWNSTIGEEEKKAALRVMESHTLSDFYGSPGDKFLGGKEIRRFEDKWSEYFQVKHSVSVNSATSALHIAVGALGIGPGDEVIVPPWTMSATVMAVIMHGATPIFADIEEGYFTIDPKAVEKKITSKTKAIMAVNLFGQACDFDALGELAKKHNLRIIEDNAQGPGGTYNGRMLGNCSDIGVFSLNCHKAIQCGEGGVAITNDDDLAKKMQLIRNHGEAVVTHNDPESHKSIIGFNFRLTEINAAIATEQLSKLDAINNYKIDIYNKVTEGLKKFEFLNAPSRRENSKHVFYLDPILYNPEVLNLERSKFVEALNAEGFKCVGGYVNPLYKLPLFTTNTTPGNIDYKSINCGVCEDYHSNTFMYLDMVRHKVTNETIDLFVNAIEKVANNADKLR